MGDAEAQDDELLALASIYEGKVFSVVEVDGMRGGQFVAPLQLNQPIQVGIKTIPGADKPKTYQVEYLPPITLHFQLPVNYPSECPPHFTLACKWLSREQLSRLCRKLDEIYEENKGEVVLFHWTQFLADESLPFLGILEVLELQPVCKPRPIHRPLETKSIENVIATQKGCGGEQTVEERAPSVLRGRGRIDRSGCRSHEIPNRGRCRGRKPVERNVDLNLHEAQRHNGSSAQNGSAAQNPSIHQRQLDATSNSVIVERTSCLAEEPSNSSLLPSRLGNSDPVPDPGLVSMNGHGSSSILLETKLVDPRAVQDAAPDSQLLPIIMEYDQQQRQLAFDATLFCCNVCFDEKLGSQCLAFKGCNHVFCRSCLRSYFEVQITSGNVQKLNCPEEKCSSQALPFQVRELVDASLYAKYDSLLLATTLETMSDIMYCPRRSCQCPVIIEPDSTMASCAACGYVFCIYCKMAYHGVAPCRLRPGEQRVLCNEYLQATPEDKKALETRYGRRQLQQLVNLVLCEDWLTTNSKTCPHCNANIEKSDGCNKMTCWRCGVHFCWLCLNRLDILNPYSHYSNPQSPCANQLFQGVVDENNEEDYEFGQFL